MLARGDDRGVAECGRHVKTREEMPPLCRSPDGTSFRNRTRIDESAEVPARNFSPASHGDTIDRTKLILMRR